MTVKRYCSWTFETFYSQTYSLRKMLTPSYILGDEYETIMCAAKVLKPGKQWAVGPGQIIDGPDFPKWISKFDPAVTATVTFNAPFDNSILYWRYKFLPSLMMDTMAMARTLRGHVLKRSSLEYVAQELGVGQKGNALLKVQGMHRQDILNAGLWGEFSSYALLDNELNYGIFLKLIAEMPPSEIQLMDLVLRTTIVPQVQLDKTLLEQHLKNVVDTKNKLMAAAAAGGGDKKTLMSTQKFKAALEARGVEIEMKTSGTTGRDTPAFAKTDQFMEDLQQHDDPVVQALACARLGVKSTLEETRCGSLLEIAELGFPEGKGFMPIPLRYGGAHTHRLSGDWGLNMQNLPRGSQLRRALMCGPDERIVVADLSQIEARLVAWLCGCKKLCDQFAGGEDVYSTFASFVFGFDVNKNNHPIHRFIGKTGVLGLGYACGAHKFLTMVERSARQYKIDLSTIGWKPDQAQEIVTKYRKLYHEIPRGWHYLDQVLEQVWLHQHRGLMKMGPVEISYGRAQLPGSLPLMYHAPKKRFDGELYFEYGKFEHKIYGAKFLENIVQYLARIIVMNAALRIHKFTGWRFWLQAHDELAFVVPADMAEGAKAAIYAEMVRRPTWGLDIPLEAEVSKKPAMNYGDAK